MSFCCGSPIDRISAVSGGVCLGPAAHLTAPGFPWRLRPELARWQAALKGQSDREVSWRGHGDSLARGEAVEDGTGDTEQDSFDERLSVLTPEGVGRAGHALTHEERGREPAVVGSARVVGGTDWTPSDEGARTAGVR
jgi:hypothetical protein